MMRVVFLSCIEVNQCPRTINSSIMSDNWSAAQYVTSSGVTWSIIITTNPCSFVHQLFFGSWKLYSSNRWFCFKAEVWIMKFLKSFTHQIDDFISKLKLRNEFLEKLFGVSPDRFGNVFAVGFCIPFLYSVTIWSHLLCFSLESSMGSINWIRCWQKFATVCVSKNVHC